MGYWRRSVDIHSGKRHMWNLTFHILLISKCELRDRPFIYMWKQNLKSHELCFFHIRCRSHRCVYSALILTPRYVTLRYLTLPEIIHVEHNFKICLFFWADMFETDLQHKVTPFKMCKHNQFIYSVPQLYC